MTTLTDSKRLAKNTALMYVRMVFLMLLSFYMSRVLLNNLGIEDYGIYNVVGSFVAIFSGIKILFATSTQRFLNFEMGRGNCKLLNTIFSTSVIVNVIISIFFLILLEVAGLWYFDGKINVAPDKLNDAHIVFHMSVLTAIVSIMTVPYDGVILAHEKMDFYAAITVLEGILKLFIALSLMLFFNNKLILYSIFLFGVSIIIRFIEYFYCKINFEECSFKLIWDKRIFKEMLSFSGWQLLGNTAYAISQHGVNIVFNFFGGPIVNAARGLSLQIFDATNRFLSSITVVANPYSVKKYAEGNSEQMYKIMYFLSKLLFLVQLFMVIPLMIFTDEALKLWLGEVPPYTIGFVRLILLYSLIRSLHGPVDIIFKAVGQLRTYQIADSVLLIMPILFSFLYLLFNVNYYIAYLFIVAFEIIDLIAILVISVKKCGLNLFNYLINVILPCATCTAISIISFSLLFCNTSLFTKLFVVVISFIMVSTYMYFKGFSTNEIQTIKSILKK